MADAEAVIEKLEAYGYPPDFLRRVGAIILLWSMIEIWLEWTIWALRKEEPRGARPSTDAKPATALISELAQEGAILTVTDKILGSLVTTTTETARDLLEYRNTLAHGHATILAPDTVLMSRNWPLFGEVKKRPHHATLASSQMLMMAIETAAVVHDMLNALHAAAGPLGQASRQKCLDMDRAIRRARVDASELRHIVAMGDHEKY